MLRIDIFQKLKIVSADKSALYRELDQVAPSIRCKRARLSVEIGDARFRQLDTDVVELSVELSDRPIQSICDFGAVGDLNSRYGVTQCLLGERDYPTAVGSESVGIRRTGTCRSYSPSSVLLPAVPVPRR